MSNNLRKNRNYLLQFVYSKIIKHAEFMMKCNFAWFVSMSR